MLRTSTLFACFLACNLAGCAEAGGDSSLADGATSPGPGYGYDGGTDATRPPAENAADGGALKPLDSIDFEGLLGDGGLFAPSDGSSGPKGELDPNGEINPKLPPKKDNPPECPSLAPPNPVGLCLGLPIYVICGYGSEGSQQYTCTCDWYHWLCV